MIELDTLRDEQRVMKEKYRARENEVDRELALYQSMCDEIRSQLKSSASSRSARKQSSNPAEDISNILEENQQLRDEIRDLQEQRRN